VLAGSDPLHQVRPIVTGIRLIDGSGLMETTWYSRQLRRIGSGCHPRPNESGLGAFAAGLLANGWLTFKTRRLRATS